MKKRKLFVLMKLDRVNEKADMKDLGDFLSIIGVRGVLPQNNRSFYKIETASMPVNGDLCERFVADVEVR